MRACAGHSSPPRRDWSRTSARWPTQPVNRDLVTDAIRQMPAVSMTPVEATYLAWIDLRDTAAADNAGAHFERFGLGLSDGIAFGGPGFVRFNFACPRSMLEKGLERLAAGYFFENDLLPRRHLPAVVVFHRSGHEQQLPRLEFDLSTGDTIGVTTLKAARGSVGPGA